MGARSPDVLMDAVTGDLPILARRLTAGQAVVAQRVRCRLQTHRGDWPLDTTVGIRWTEHLGRKPADVEALAIELALEISGTPGVDAVEDLSWSDAPDVTVTATIRTTDGDSVSVVVAAQGADGNPSITVGGILAASSTVAP